MKKEITCALLVALVLSPFLVNLTWAQEVVLYGQVSATHRGRAVPASALKIILTQDGRESKPVYTSPSGRYGVYALPGPFGSYVLKVYSGQNLLKSVAIQITKKGMRFDIRLP